ncbi:TraU family protein, partial [Escherichia coli]|uniref:TraU family protein n=1 Tax=Escherichia coli TaxID=562 RepID=UPI00320A7CCB
MNRKIFALFALTAGMHLAVHASENVNTQCHPFGRSVMRWETGKNPPNTKKNFGYLMWRKRNCVFL